MLRGPEAGFDPDLEGKGREETQGTYLDGVWPGDGTDRGRVQTSMECVREVLAGCAAVPGPDRTGPPMASAAGDAG